MNTTEERWLVAGQSRERWRMVPRPCGIHIGAAKRSAQATARWNLEMAQYEDFETEVTDLSEAWGITMRPLDGQKTREVVVDVDELQRLVNPGDRKDG